MNKPSTLVLMAIILASLSFTAHSQDAEPITLIMKDGKVYKNTL